MFDMKAMLVSLTLGILVGGIYSAFGVRSPAPPVIALVGLLGILVGEQVTPKIKQAFFETTVVSKEIHSRKDGDDLK